MFLKCLNLETAWARNGHSLQTKHPNFFVHMTRWESCLSVHDRSQYEIVGARRNSVLLIIVGSWGMAVGTVALGCWHSERISVLPLINNPVPGTNVYYAIVIEILVSKLIQVTRFDAVHIYWLHSVLVNAQDWKEETN